MALGKDAMAVVLGLVPLRGGKELQCAMVVLIPVPMHEVLAPYTSFFQRSKAFRLEVRPVLQRPEQGLRTSVIVAHAWSAVRGSYPQLVKLLEYGGALHRAAVVRMQNQRRRRETALPH